MAPKQPPKRKRLPEPSPPQLPRNVSTPISKEQTVPVAETSSGVRLSSSMMQARDYAVEQARREGVLGNYKVFDSLYDMNVIIVMEDPKFLMKFKVEYIPEEAKSGNVFDQESNRSGR